MDSRGWLSPHSDFVKTLRNPVASDTRIPTIFYSIGASVSASLPGERRTVVSAPHDLCFQQFSSV